MLCKVWWRLTLAQHNGTGVRSNFGMISLVLIGCSTVEVDVQEVIRIDQIMSQMDRAGPHRFSFMAFLCLWICKHFRFFLSVHFVYFIGPWQSTSRQSYHMVCLHWKWTLNTNYCYYWYYYYYFKMHSYSARICSMCLNYNIIVMLHSIRLN